MHKMCVHKMHLDPMFVYLFIYFSSGAMVEEEQFVNIDLNDDNICTICKLDTDTGTLSFCHVCFELSIEGKCPCLANLVLKRPFCLRKKGNCRYFVCFRLCH